MGHYWYVNDSALLRSGLTTPRSLRAGLVRVLSLDRSIVLYCVGGRTALGIIGLASGGTLIGAHPLEQLLAWMDV